MTFVSFHLENTSAIFDVIALISSYLLVFSPKTRKCRPESFRISILFTQGAENALSQKLPVFVIRNMNKPRCFKNLNFFLAATEAKKKLDEQQFI